MSADDLVRELKAALVERELRIVQLELQLAGLRPSQGAISNGQPERAVDPVNVPSHIDVSDDTRLHPALVRSLGLHPDRWLAPDAYLTFDQDIAGRTICLSLYLPAGSGAAKTIRASPTFGIPVEFVVERGGHTLVQLKIPEGSEQPSIGLHTEQVDVFMGDDRKLGALVADLQIVD